MAIGEPGQGSTRRVGPASTGDRDALAKGSAGVFGLGDRDSC